MSDLEQMLRQAVAEIRRLRAGNEILGVQVAVVDVFRAALLGPPRGQGMAPDICWEIERYLERKPEPQEPDALSLARGARAVGPEVEY